MKTWNAKLLYKAELSLGEGAIWHTAWKKFLFVDIEGKKVGCIDPQTKIVEERYVDKRVGTVVSSNNDNLIVALQGSIEELNFITGETKQLIKIENEKPDNRCNEGKCDATGRLWIGTMHVAAKPHEGALYKFDGELTKMIDKTSVSNGICWSPDNAVMYYIDTFDCNIKAFDFDLLQGTLLNERVVIKMDKQEDLPDGMCIDEEGMLWVAIWDGSCVHRYNPHTGNLTGKVFVDALQITSCAFGGNNMNQLFITTARKGMSKAQLQQYPYSGSLFMADTPYRGGLPNTFTHLKKLDYNL